MRVCGIICEFNPFHNGHRYLIEQVRALGFDAVVCVMSGNFVQRGEYAFCDKKLRAQSAIASSADLVLSLPFPWSSASAEIFARAGVSILDRLGFIDSICFGSESGDTRALVRCAECVVGIKSEDVIALQKKDPRVSYAGARQALVKDALGDELSGLLSSSNDILGVEYIKAIINSGSKITPIAIKRVGASHSGESFVRGFSSSSAIRDYYTRGCAEDASEFISEKDVTVLSSCAKAVNYGKYFDILTGAVLSRTPEELSDFYEIGGGFEYAIYKELLVSKNYDELTAALSARHLTDAKIRRALLSVACGVKKQDVSCAPAFTELLAANDIGRGLLGGIRGNEDISIISKGANIRVASDEAKAQYKLQRKAEMIFEKITDSIN